MLSREAALAAREMNRRHFQERKEMQMQRAIAQIEKDAQVEAALTALPTLESRLVALEEKVDLILDAIRKKQ